MAESPRYAIVAGLSCSGKTTLIRLLRDGGLDHVLRDVGLAGVEGSISMDACQLEDGMKPDPGALNLIHYDLLRTIREPHVSDYETDPVFPLLADTVPEMIIHMDPDPQVLQNMLSVRIRKRRFSLRHLFRPFDETRRLRFLLELRMLYADPDWLNDQVGRWRGFALSRFICPHVVVHHHGFRRPDWRDYVRVHHVTEPMERLFRSCGSLSG